MSRDETDVIVRTQYHEERVIASECFDGFVIERIEMRIDAAVPSLHKFARERRYLRLPVREHDQMKLRGVQVVIDASPVDLDPWHSVAGGYAKAANDLA